MKKSKNSNKNNVYLWKGSEANHERKRSDYFYLIAFLKRWKKSKLCIKIQVLLNIRRFKISLKPVDFYCKRLQLQKTRGTHNKRLFLFH